MALNGVRPTQADTLDSTVIPSQVSIDLNSIMQLMMVMMVMAAMFKLPGEDTSKPFVQRKVTALKGMGREMINDVNPFSAPVGKVPRKKFLDGYENKLIAIKKDVTAANRMKDQLEARAEKITVEFYEGVGYAVYQRE